MRKCGGCEGACGGVRVWECRSGNKGIYICVRVLLHTYLAQSDIMDTPPAPPPGANIHATSAALETALTCAAGNGHRKVC